MRAIAKPSRSQTWSDDRARQVVRRHEVLGPWGDLVIKLALEATMRVVSESNTGRGWRGVREEEVDKRYAKVEKIPGGGRASLACSRT